MFFLEMMAGFRKVLATKDDIAKIFAVLEKYSRILEEYSRILAQHSKK